MKILIVASWYPDELNPNYGIFIQEQALMLIEFGHEVVVLNVEVVGGFISFMRLLKHESNLSTEIDIPVARVKVRPVLPGMRIFNYKRLCSKVFKFIKTNDHLFSEIDIIHAHAVFSAGVVAFEIGKKFNIPFILTEHSSGLIYNINQYSFLEKRLLKRVYTSAFKLIHVSSFSLRQINEKFGLTAQNSCVINNFISPLFYDFVPPSSVDGFKYVVIGSLSPRKRVGFIINCWSRLIQTFPDSELIIVGKGEELIAKKIRDLELESSVKIIPELSRSEIAQLIRESQVVISSSAVETFGLSIAEAVVSGRPVVSTDSGGVLDIINKENGVIADFSEISFTNALISMRKNYETYNFYSIHRNGLDKFSRSVIYNQLLAVYLAALE